VSAPAAVPPAEGLRAPIPPHGAPDLSGSVPPALGSTRGTPSVPLPATTLPFGMRPVRTPAAGLPPAPAGAWNAEGSTPPRGVPSGSTPPLPRNAPLPGASPDADAGAARRAEAPGDRKARRARARERSRDDDDGELMPLDPDTLPTDPPRIAGSRASSRIDARATERTLTYAADDPDMASDTILSLPAMTGGVTGGESLDPLLRFHDPVTLATTDTSPSVPDMPPPPDERAVTEAPLVAPRAEDAGRRARLITPATALFAEPDPDPATESALTHVLTTSAPSVDRLPSQPATATDAEPERKHRTLRRTLLLLGLAVVIAAAAAAGGYYLLEHRDDTAAVQAPAPSPRTSTVGAVRIVVTPADAVIAIPGLPVHTGSPWAVELAPGVHQIEIHRDGYKAWLTSTDVVAGRTSALSVSLEPLGPAMADAMLVLGSTPPALEAVLDGVPVAERTPLRLAIKPGPHAIALRKDGVEVWRTTLDARASTNYEYNPVVAQPAARAPAAAQGPSVATPVAPPATDLPGAPRGSNSGPDRTATARPADPAPSPGAPPARPDETTPAVPAPPSGAAVGPVAPLIVPPSAVSRVSGTPPTITKPRATDLPVPLSAKLCIDETGHVTSAEIVEKIPAAAAAEILGALHTWLYTPYRAGGITRAVCFVVPLHVT
ncbi:MAG TPA: PEGA domain-containing protein, partial [Kofleriaceae bacterium]|nr:PEGA domain-containing protein [Kofleriaceae bacterium]